MRCEHAQNCGFYLYLEANNKASGGDCGKEHKEECPRYGEKRGRRLTDYQRKAYHLREDQKQMYPVQEAITNEEMRLAKDHGLYGV